MGSLPTGGIPPRPPRGPLPPPASLAIRLVQDDAANQQERQIDMPISDDYVTVAERIAIFRENVFPLTSRMVVYPRIR